MNCRRCTYLGAYALSLKHEKQWHQMSSEIIRWHRASSIDMIYMKNGYR